MFGTVFIKSRESTLQSRLSGSLSTHLLSRQSSVTSANCPFRFHIGERTENRSNRKFRQFPFDILKSTVLPRKFRAANSILACFSQESALRTLPQSKQFIRHVHIATSKVCYKRVIKFIQDKLRGPSLYAASYLAKYNTRPYTYNFMRI